MAWIECCDLSYSHPRYPELHAAGIQGVLRYVSRTPGKGITAAERDAIWAAGMWILLMHETTATAALGGRSAGLAAAHEARTIAAGLGYPTDLLIIYAVDFDATPAQLNGPIAAFAAGVNSIDPTPAEYGGVRTVNFLTAHKLSGGGFQTYAWSGDGKGGITWSPHAVIEQYRNGVKLAGGVVDLCRAQSTLNFWEPNMPISHADLAAIGALFDTKLKAALADPATVKAFAAQLVAADVAFAVGPPFPANTDFAGDPAARPPVPGNVLNRLGYQWQDTAGRVRAICAHLGLPDHD